MEQGMFVKGVFGGLDKEKVRPKEGEAFERLAGWVNVGTKYPVTIVCTRDEEASMERVLRPLVGQKVVLRVEPWQFREMHFLEVVSEGAK